MSILWRDEMSVDHGVIDHDHQTLIAIVNEFCDIGEATKTIPKMQEILNRLGQYARVHFAREETLQKAVRYAFLEAHHHEHMELLNQMVRVRGELEELMRPADAPEPDSGADAPAEAKPDTPRAVPDISQIHAELVTLLHHWLVDHIIKSDLRMKPYVAQMAPHAKAMRPLSQSVI